MVCFRLFFLCGLAQENCTVNQPGNAAGRFPFSNCDSLVRLGLRPLCVFSPAHFLLPLLKKYSDKKTLEVYNNKINCGLTHLTERVRNSM
jgi:hypothetical protein